MGSRRTRSSWSGKSSDEPGPAATSLLSVLALAMLTVATRTDTFAEGLVLGLVAAVGIAGSQIFLAGYFDPMKPQPMVWVAITGGYHVVGLMVSAVILALWR
ncbi:MAG: DUF1761 family protein [Micromonosporaceae bacterium]|nr:DUF1761 family protein [Micromonosporaceae bacterium]